jgi:iron complex transport system substrate-binding protein
VQTGNVVELDADIASRWGPRIVELAASIAGALEEYHRG